jgi:hypothetical protein
VRSIGDNAVHLLCHRHAIHRIKAYSVDFVTVLFFPKTFDEGDHRHCPLLYWRYLQYFVDYACYGGNVMSGRSARGQDKTG